MPQETIKIKLDKVNSLFNVFLKDGIEKTSKLERDLLKIQLNSLITELDKFDDTLISEHAIISPTKKEEEIIEQFQKVIETKLPEPIKGEVSELIIKEEEIKEEEKLTEIEPEIQNITAPILETKVDEALETNEKPFIQFIAEDRDDEEENVLDLGEEKIFSTNKPTRSLKEVIDLNKSFILRAKLFVNNNENYKAFIDELNTFETEQASFQFVEQAAIKNAWNKEDKAYELLLRAVEKRFLPLI